MRQAVAACSCRSAKVGSAAVGGSRRQQQQQLQRESIAAAFLASQHLMHCWLQVRTFSYGGTPVTLKEGALGDGVGAKVWTVAHIVCRWVTAWGG